MKRERITELKRQKEFLMKENRRLVEEVKDQKRAIDSLFRVLLILGDTPKVGR